MQTKNAPKTESELLKEAEDAAIRARAALLLEEQQDEVKRMNQMMLYSKCVAIRSAVLRPSFPLFAIYIFKLI